MRRRAPLVRVLPRALRPVGLALPLALAGCMSLSPQLQPTDFEALERLESREEREQAYIDNAIYPQQDPRGGRYVKGTAIGATPRGWQSLDVVLRSDANSAAALPHRKLRASRIMFALALGTATVAVAGIAASAREGLDLKNLNGTGAILLGGGIATVGLALGSGIAYGQARRGYERAVNVYNDSLGVRLGVYTPAGEYIPPDNVLVDEEGYIILDQKELLIDPRGKPPARAPEGTEAADSVDSENPAPAGAEVPSDATGREPPPEEAGEGGALDSGAEPSPRPEREVPVPEPASRPTPNASAAEVTLPRPGIRAGRGLTLLPAR